MVNLMINGVALQVEEGTTLLEAARFLGFPIATLCHMDGLTPYGACRLCVVEIGEGANAKLVTSCTYPAQEGLKVRTGSERVVKARRMIIELLLATAPQSKVIQDLASKFDNSLQIPVPYPRRKNLSPVRVFYSYFPFSEQYRSQSHF